MLKGWRTVIFNVLSLLVLLAGIVLQYLDALGLTDLQAAYAGLGLNIFVAVANVYLRTITTTPLGKKL
jgi:hypothetical protein